MTNGWRADTQGSTENLAKSTIQVVGALPGSDYAELSLVLYSVDGIIYKNTGTYATPVWTAQTSAAGQAYDSVHNLDTTHTDYTLPASATASSVGGGGSTVTYETDFSAGTGWTLGTSATISGGTLNIVSAQNTARTSYYDLTSVSATWVLRFKFSGTTLTNTTSGQGMTFNFGIGATNAETAESPTQDALSFALALHSAGSTSNFYSWRWETSGAAQTAGTSRAEPLTITRWIEVIHQTNNLRVKVYTDAYGIVEETIDLAITSANYTGLRYLFARAYQQATADVNTYVIDDVKFYDGITSVVDRSAAVAMNGSLSDYWSSGNEANPNIYFDFGSARDHIMLCLALHTATTTETQIKIRISTDASFSDGETVRTINVSDFTNDTYRFILINRLAANARYIQVYGVTASAVVLAVTEFKSRYGVADATMQRDHYHKKLNLLTVHSGVDSN